MIVASLMVLSGWSVTGAGASAQQAADTSGTVAAASAGRERAEQRLEQTSTRLAEIEERLARQFVGAEELAEQLQTARAEMRRSAVRAYVDGGSLGAVSALLDSDDLADSSRREVYTAEMTLDWSDSVADYEMMKQQNDPVLVELVDARERAAALVADATDALLQARATEAEAERAQAEAQRRQAEQQAARVAAEQAAARQRASTPAAGSGSRATATPRSPQPGTVPASGSPTPRSTPTQTPTQTSGGPVRPSSEFSAPLVGVPPGGPTEEQWAALRKCESGGNYQIVSSSGRYRGAYQFDRGTWESLGGRGDPAAAPPAEQDGRAKLLYAQRGHRPWPHCGKALL